MLLNKFYAVFRLLRVILTTVKFLQVKFHYQQVAITELVAINSRSPFVSFVSFQSFVVVRSWRKEEIDRKILDKLKVIEQYKSYFK